MPQFLYFLNSNVNYFQLVERRLNFHNDHLGGNYTAMYATTEPQTDSDQESYV